MISIHPYLANVYPRIINNINAIRIVCSISHVSIQGHSADSKQAASERSPTCSDARKNKIYLTKIRSEPNVRLREKSCSFHLFQLHILGTAVPKYAVCR